MEGDLGPGHTQVRAPPLTESWVTTMGYTSGRVGGAGDQLENACSVIPSPVRANPNHRPREP